MEGLRSAGAAGRRTVNRGGRALTRVAGMDRRILDFRPNGPRGWLVELDCGHQALLRADPDHGQWAWLLTPEGRCAHVGCLLPCAACGRM